MLRVGFLFATGHRLLHALSGTVSMGLQIRGPNFGVGGGPHGPGEALLAAAALLQRGTLPGAWLERLRDRPAIEAEARELARLAPRVEDG